MRQCCQEHLYADEEVLQPLRHISSCVGGELLIDLQPVAVTAEAAAVLRSLCNNA
jgi:hypothetical protein